MIQLNFAIFVTYGFLTLALLSLWLPQACCRFRHAQSVWLAWLGMAIAAGLFFRILQPMALVWIALFGAGAWALNQEKTGKMIKYVSFAVICLLALGLMTHRLPGFANPKIIANLRLGPDALPYDKYLNFDSAVIGLFIVGFGHQRLRRVSEWRGLLKNMAVVTPITWVVVLCSSLALGYVQWQPKWTPIFFLWAWNNLLFTCVVEESFFRGFLQKYLMRGFTNIRHGDALAVAIAAALFGLKHYVGGGKYMLLATIAGIGYGWAYRRTRHLEASILTHFSLNSLHFLLFTYPALAAALQ